MKNIKIIKLSSTSGPVCSRHGKPRTPEPAYGAEICVNGVILKSEAPRDQIEEDFINASLIEASNMESTANKWDSLEKAIKHFTEAANDRSGTIQTGIEMREAAIELSKLYKENK